MNNENARGAALARAAEAMLRALGGAAVKFRCPAAAVEDAQARQLGLEAPVPEEIAVAPVVTRPSEDGFELLIAPSSLAPLIADRGQTATQFFDAVLAVCFSGREFQVKSFDAEQFAATDYLYRVLVTAKS